MAVAIATTGKYTTFSSTNATLATALSEVLTELSSQNKSLTKTSFVTFQDGTSYSLVAIVKN